MQCMHTCKIKTKVKTKASACSLRTYAAIQHACTTRPYIGTRMKFVSIYVLETGPCNLKCKRMALISSICKITIACDTSNVTN